MWWTSMISWCQIKELILDNVGGFHPISERPWEQKQVSQSKGNSIPRLSHRNPEFPACLTDLGPPSSYNHRSQFLEITQVALLVKNPLTNASKAKNTNLIPELERFPRVGNSNPLQYSCLGNPMDREEPGGLQSTGSQSQTWLSAHTHTHTHTHPPGSLCLLGEPKPHSSPVWPTFLPSPCLFTEALVYHTAAQI